MSCSWRGTDRGGGGAAGAPLGRHPRSSARVRIAYIILAHRYPDHLIRLIERLSADGARFFVHIDKKAPAEVSRRVIEAFRPAPHVHLVPRHRVVWGRFGVVQATLEGIGEIVRRRFACDFGILLSGQDYPIKSNAQIFDYLAHHKGQSFLDYERLPSPRRWLNENGGLNRIEYWHFRVGDLPLEFPRPFPAHTAAGRIAARAWAGLCRAFPRKRTLPNGLVPYGGSAFWCLTGACLRYVYDFSLRHRNVARFFRYVDVPDEVFFQTIVMNSAYRHAVINDNLRYVAWPKLPAAHPEILGEDDFERIVTSGKLFARKFDPAHSARLLEMIDQRIGGAGDRRD